MPQPNLIILVIRLDRTTGESQYALDERSDMTRPYWKPLFVFSAIAASPLLAHAEPTDAELTALREQLQKQQQIIEQQQQRLAALEQNNTDNWLSERRYQEVQAIVREVLADAETRASLLQDGLTAGYNRGFFIGNQENTYYLRVNPEFQFRYIYNTRDGEAPDTDEDENGFQLRRTRLDFRGHAITPDLTYRLRFLSDRGDGSIDLDIAYVAYNLIDGLNIKVGQFKPLFAREENVAAFQQLAVERSYTADYFTIDRSQGVELVYSGWDNLRLSLAIHDGSYSADSEFNADRTNFAIAGRVELLLAGDWKQFDDFSSWSKDKFGLLLGIAGGYERGEEGSGTNTPDIYKFTADVSVEVSGINVFVAGYLQKFSDNDDPSLPSDLDDATQFGLVAQAGVFVIPDKLELFGRYEWIDFDGVYYRNNGAGTQSGTGNLAEDELSLITFGANWYLVRHNAKFTFDVIWALDPVPVSNSGAGLLTSVDDDQVVLRAQWQFAF